MLMLLNGSEYKVKFAHILPTQKLLHPFSQGLDFRLSEYLPLYRIEECL